MCRRPTGDAYRMQHDHHDAGWRHRRPAHGLTEAGLNLARRRSCETPRTEGRSRTPGRAAMVSCTGCPAGRAPWQRWSRGRHPILRDRKESGSHEIRSTTPGRARLDTGSCEIWWWWGLQVTTRSAAASGSAAGVEIHGRLVKITFTGVVCVFA